MSSSMPPEVSSALAPISQHVQTPAPITMPQPVNKTELRRYLALITDAEALDLQKQLAAAYDTACAALLGPNDVQVENEGKSNERSFKKKSAWNKLARHFSISSSILSQSYGYVNDATTGESSFVAICSVRAVAAWGQVVDAQGACGTDEEKGRRKITIADAIATAQTRATNRAISNLIAMGEVSAEEVSRNTPTEVEQETVRQLTIEEANAYPFPWRQPEKYRDKPLGDLSTKMLATVRDAIAKEIAEKGETVKRAELLQACTLLIASREKEGASAGEKAANSESTTKTREPGDESGIDNSPQTPEPRTFLLVTDGSGYDHLVAKNGDKRTLCDADIKKSWKRHEQGTTLDVFRMATASCEVCSGVAHKLDVSSAS